MTEHQDKKSSRKSGAKASKAIRPLGGNETYQLAMYILDLYRGTSVICRYAIPPTMTVANARSELMSTIRAAIARVVLKHPLLQVGVGKAESRKPFFVPLDSLDLGQLITWRFIEGPVDEDSLRETAQSEVDNKFDGLDSLPCWRVLILHPQYTDSLEIVFTFNHSHADGMGGKVFHEDLLQTLNAGITDEERQQFDQNVVKLPDCTPRFTPTTPQLAKLPVTNGFIVKTLWDEMKPGMLRKDVTLATWAPILTSLPYKTQLRSFAVDAGTLTNILAACRKHKTTLTGLIHGLALVSLASRLDEHKAPAFEAATALDQRKFLPSSHPSYPGLDPKRTVANYVSLMGHGFDTQVVSEVRSKLNWKKTSNESLSDELAGLTWSAAAKVRREIQERLDLGLKNDLIGLMKFIGDWRTQMKKDARKPRQFSWLVTNLGVVDGQPGTGTTALSSAKDENWAIRRAQFVLSTEVPSGVWMIAPFAVKDGPLCMTFSSQDGVVDVGLAEGFVGDIHRWLVQIGSTQS
ncbi:Uu.00g139810.m01.CDS01 [Anthostomella pinea]|uniref:Uu.00g139810.m01.CDS01 n=1 Tax=Anthostomella pinea TaxID=933095 RepID=A0AAI8VQ16_9PEZI|nr:Uu.00g139810.m01.CDS01 [Anthostomella pinea]